MSERDESRDPESGEWFAEMFLAVLVIVFVVLCKWVYDWLWGR